MYLKNKYILNILMKQCEICECNINDFDYKNHLNDCKITLHILKLMNKNFDKLDKKKRLENIILVNNSSGLFKDEEFKEFENEPPEIKIELVRYMLSEEFINTFKKCVRS